MNGSVSLSERALKRMTRSRAASAARVSRGLSRVVLGVPCAVVVTSSRAVLLVHPMTSNISAAATLWWRDNIGCAP